MSEGLNYPFTAEQICNQARGNANGLILAMTAYAIEHSISTDEMWRSIGGRFALGWEGLRGAPVLEVAKRFALNWVSFGAEVRSLAGDDVKAQFVYSGWPSAESLEFWGLSLEDVSHGAAPASIAEYLGLTFEWSRAGDEVTFLFSRPGAA
jgi:hypothetical protein